jgi:hypothetical protein
MVLVSCDESHVTTPTPPEPPPGGDTTPPTITKVVPVNGATSIQLASTIQVVFSEQVQPSTVNGSTFSIHGSGAVDGTVTLADSIALFAPSAPFAPNTTYTARVTAGVKDLAGNPLASEYIWSFTTGPVPDTTPPTVVAITPGNSAAGVAPATTIEATFSELVKASTVTTGTFLVTGSGPVSGTVTLNGSTAVFTPSGPLDYATAYTARVTGVQDLAGNTLASDFVWTFTTAPPPDVTPPSVISVAPLPGETGVGVSSTVRATFSEAVEPATVTTSTLTLEGSGGPVAGSVTLTNFTATFTPSSPLAYSTTYTARVTTGVHDLAGNAMASDTSWTFTTGAAPDLTPPTVTDKSPLAGATNVSIGTAVTATFSEAVAPGSVTTASFLLTGTGPVAGTVSLNGTTATFTPSSSLAYGTTYTARITTAVQDLAGNHLASEQIWSFTTPPPPDVTPPTVTAVTPLAGATGVAVATTVTATFSEALASASVSPTTFLVTGVGPVGGTVALNGTTATFTPSSPLAYSTTYTARITTGVEDVAGNNLAADFTWTFTTGAAPDTTPPAVTANTPLAGATGVPVATTVTATFSEAVAPASVSTTTFRLTGGAPVAGTVTLNGTTATFTPSSPLAYSTTYTARITTGVEDVAGNNLAADFVWTFTTGAAPDLTPPTVTAVSPLAGATGVPIGTAVSGTFSEALAPASVSATTFTLAAGVVPVLGTVSLAGQVATFTPLVPLLFNTTYTAHLTTGIEDEAGNNLAVEFVWSFTTGLAPDTTPPTVSSTTPLDGATGVSAGTTVSATFSEDIAPASATSATFLLNGGSPVAGTVSVAGSTATFTPSAPLASNTTYTATLETGIEDLAGNNLQADFVWSFTTVVMADQAPVADAGPDQDVAFGQTVTLDGTGSSDPDGDPLTYTWTETEGIDVTGGSGTLTGPKPTFTAPSEIARLDFDLVVSDGALSSPADGVSIYVAPEVGVIHVAPTGSDSNAGTRAAPLRTIGTGLTAAASGGHPLFIAGGTYTESITLPAGVQAYGGFDPATWRRNPSTFETTIDGGRIAVTGTASTHDIALDGLVIKSANATVPGQSSYAILLDHSQTIAVTRCLILPGTGAPGAEGTGGASGQSGGVGSAGHNGNCDKDDAPGQPGAGGAGFIFDGGPGGRGGLRTAFAGSDGDSGQGPAAGSGGPGGVATADLDGAEGQPGGPGGTGASGGGGTAWGAWSGLDYIPAAGDAGTSGESGSGGGGGGGSSGGAAVDADAGSGNGGGGGGGGGQGGLGGGAGGGGGGSFGIVLLGATGVTVTDCVIQTSAGGAGGAGGSGGAGGPGGAGAPGAQRCANEIGAGGTGGDGGAGGTGGGGGGGGGGPSVGFVHDASAVLNESGTTVDLGPAGAAGGGPGTPGSPGVAIRSIDLSSPPAARRTASR